MRYILSTLIVLVSTIVIFGHGANAKTIDSGELIKASSPAVYYYFDGKRYVFPNEDVYLSWYENFDDVNVVSDAALASVPLGGNVSYRPGTRLVKIVSDPKVYMVYDKNELRWITTEADAVTLYGEDWAKEVRDVSDALFTDYQMGEALTDLGDRNQEWKNLVKYAYPYYATVQKELIADKSTGDINDFVHPNNIIVTNVSDHGYTATSSMSMDEIYDFFKSNSEGWVSQVDYFHGYVSGTARLLNFSKAVGDSFAHRSIIISDEDKADSSREILFNEVVFPKGYLSYPGAVTISYLKGDFDIEQGFITNATKEEMENWYTIVGSSLGWTKSELVEDTLGLMEYYRMENSAANTSLQHVYFNSSSTPEFVGLVIGGSEFNKTIR